MSGIKDVTVTMTRKERNRLLNNARRAEESEQQALQRVQLSQNALNAANSKLETLNRTLNNEIAGLQGDMRQLANDQNRRLREQAAEQNRRLQEQANAFNHSIADVNRRMEDQRRALESSINHVRQQAENNRRELQSAINKINAKIEAKENNQRKIAEFWISQTEAYLNDISQYRHDMFVPGQLARLKTELDQMRSDMKNGIYQAAISTARGIFNRAVDLKETIVNAEFEWSYYHGLFTQNLADVQSNLIYHQNMQFDIAMEHGEEKVEANINYWTNGALNTVGASIAEVQRQTGNIEQVPTPKLKDSIESLNQLNLQMEAAANEAKEAIISSKQRAEMANRLADALGKLAWDFRDEGKDGLAYEGNDFNKPVHVNMSDGMGNEIAVVISPEAGSQDMANKLEINFFDPKNNDEAQRQIWISSIQDCLREGGVNVGKPVCREGYEAKPSDNDRLRDIKAVASR